MIILILLSLSLICLLIAYKDYKKDLLRKQKKKERAKTLTAIPWNAADEISSIIPKDYSSNKEYKLAVLIIEDEYGKRKIEDIDLRGDTAEEVKLSSFAINKNKDKADRFLFDYHIINSLSNRVNCYVEKNIERYYAFQLSLENILSGRHGKIKTKVKNKFIIFMDLSENELIRLANLTIA